MDLATALDRRHLDGMMRCVWSRVALLIGSLSGYVVVHAGEPPVIGDRLVNLAVRAELPAGGSTIPGFVLSGERATVLIRAGGPALAAFGVPGTVSNPRLRLFRGETEIAANDDWDSSAVNGAAVSAAVSVTGAFPFAPGSKDAALVVELDPGPYTAAVTNMDGSGGEFILEVYRVPARVLTPIEAIAGAANDPGNGIAGTFKLTVRAVGSDASLYYVNSESDYHDQRCLTLELPPAVALEVASRLGMSNLNELVGKTLEVTGTAKRTTIWIYDNGVRTALYYYQTHVAVEQATQVEMVGS